MKQKNRHNMKFQESINPARLETNTCFIGGVLMERTHYYTIFSDRGRNIRYCVLIVGEWGCSNRGRTVFTFSIYSVLTDL